MVLLTKNSQFSPYVQQEIGMAKAKNKLIIPLVEPGLSATCLAMLQGTEYISFDRSKPQDSLSRLLAYLNRLKESREQDNAILFAFGALLTIAILTSKK